MDIVTLHCSSCGATFPANATRCGHCAAEVTIEERGLDCLCHVCGARMSSRAKFCMRCGKPAALQPTTPAAALRPCPRCKGALRERAIDGGGPLAKTIECGQCGGLWLAPEVIDRLCANAEAAKAASVHLLGLPAPTLRIDPGPVRYLPCPRCGEFMVRRNFGSGSGVIVDLCRNHGVWFDHAELEKVLEFARGGGLEEQRVREVERLKREARDARDRINAPVHSGYEDPFGRAAFSLPAILSEIIGYFRKGR